HAVAVVGQQLDVLGDGRRGEARPTRAGLELRIRAEQLVPAGRAAVGAVVLREGVLARERRLGAAAAEHLVLLGCELLAPLEVACRSPAISALRRPISEL